MPATHDPTRPHEDRERYEIRVEGRLDDRWAEWVDGLTFTYEADRTTRLTGPLADQSALHGVLNRMRDLGVPIISVRRLNSPPSPSSEGDGQPGQRGAADV